ncbi:hypothetical protein [Rhodopseudomonas pseudopalustris]|uniref:DNA polymerase III beta subunit, central domain n=1 Tax=Rhodopseudomonas pseudopalustris TaxID=1513892 RepID=A0A1H8WI14_9BRAD|nr:hypothetical protein [Rhodopseudomonas pseudopalustris]SEP27281.1 DNA polymerase III beta subunit, central domain [Rhodopseudomonas pseudopalustris]
MLRFNANLFRIAMLAASNEETRYYLNGVFVEPQSGGGVRMTATDGRKLICIFDESGEANESAIINLRDALKLCRPKGKERRDVIIDTGSNDARVCLAFEYSDKSGKTERGFGPMGAAYNVRIDGSFPDYRRAVPKAFKNVVSPAFASQHLGLICAIGAEIAAHFHDFRPRASTSDVNRLDQILITAQDDESPGGGPALITWPRSPAVFMLLMPTRASEIHGSLPGWFNAPTPATTATAQAAE